MGRDVRELNRSKIAAIGSATADALGEYGVSVDLIPPRHIAESLLDELTQSDLEGRRIPSARRGRRP